MGFRRAHRWTHRSRLSLACDTLQFILLYLTQLNLSLKCVVVVSPCLFWRPSALISAPVSMAQAQPRERQRTDTCRLHGWRQCRPKLQDCRPASESAASGTFCRTQWPLHYIYMRRYVHSILGCLFLTLSPVFL
jgi:hypothetical protein